MIAAVWSARGQEHAQALVRRFALRFGEPAACETSERGALIGWRGVREVRKVEGGLLAGRGRPSREGFDGNFARVAWSRTEAGAASTAAPADGITCARSAYGGEPLFYAFDGVTAIVSSRMEVVRCGQERAGVDLNRSYLSHLLNADTPSSTATLHRHITRVRSGETLRFPYASFADSGGSSRQAAEAEVDGDPDVLADRLWMAVRASVGRATEGARVVGVLAGGGVDSSGLLAATVAHARERGDLTVVPLAIDFASPGDDRPHRRALEAALRVEAVCVTPEEAGAFVEPSLAIDGRPGLYPSLALAAAAVTAGKRHGVERILSGFLGDLVLDAPPYALLERALSGGPFAAASVVASVARFGAPWMGPWHSRLRQLLISPLLRTWVPRHMLAARRRQSRNRFTPSWAGPVMLEHMRRLPAYEDAPPTRTPAERRHALSVNVQMLEQIDTRAQLEVLTGVPFVEPWMDAEFIGALAAIPAWRLAHGDRDRGLFRHALRGHVPDLVRLRPDKADIEPAFDRMLTSAGGRSAFTDVLGAPRLVALGLVDAARFSRAEHRFFLGGSAGDRIDTGSGADEASWLLMWNAYAAEAACAAAERAVT